VTPVDGELPPACGGAYWSLVSQVSLVVFVDVELPPACGAGYVEE